MTDYFYNALSMFFGGLGLGFPDMIILIVALTALIFSIQDFRIGFMVWFLLNICTYIAFTLFNLDVSRITILVFTSLIFLAFSLFTTRTGGKIV